MGPLTIICLLHNFHNLNSWIIQFFLVVPSASYLSCLTVLLRYLRLNLEVAYLALVTSMQQDMYAAVQSSVLFR